MFFRVTSMITTIFFSLLIPFTTAISFNFTSFSSNDTNITYERASAENNAIQLITGNVSTITNDSLYGRATYSKSMQLWDKASGRLADFTTHFSFAINSQNKTKYADGLAFFLAPSGSKIPEESTGGSLGLTRSKEAFNSSDNPFVAVEFDIYENEWDPPGGEHVGININSVISVANISWLANIKEGKTCEAWISYDSTSQNLSVVFTGFRNNVTQMQVLYAYVNLSSYLPERVTFGFSAATGLLSANYTIYSWNFSSTLEPHNNIPAPKQEKKNNLGLAMGVSASGIVLVVGLTFVLVYLWKKNRGNKGDDHDEYMEDDLDEGTGPKKFSYNKLARATGNFKDEQKLGQGGFGAVYKGILRDSNSYVAVKRVSKGSRQGMKEYASEVKIITQLRHRNLVQLIGWCHERDELLLVYEYMPNGSLDSHLFKENSLLMCAVRYKIAQGLASALLYLHEEWEQCVVHRDIKSSNIMLDSNFNAKLGDFGLARLVDHDKGSQTTVLAGTMGYMAPECVTGKASKEADVYSFGIVALEIACGRTPIDPKAPEDQIVMAEWVWELHRSGKVLEAADPRLSGDFDEQQMERLMIVGLWCAQANQYLRPSIRQAIQVLNFEAPLPLLSSNMPGPTCYASPAPGDSLPVSFSHIDSEEGPNQYQSYSYNTNSSPFISSSTGASPYESK